MTVTALDAARNHGYRMVLAEDATSARSAFTRTFPRLGRVASCDDVVAALGG